jgi:Alginate export
VKSFANFFLISSALASLGLIPNATRAQTSPSSSYSSEDTAIRPESVVSGYPVSPTYTLLRYDEDYSFLANPANRTEPLDVIKYIPLFNLGPFFRAFVQLKSSEEEGREPGPRPIDRKRLDFGQAFVDFSYPRSNLSTDKSFLTLRLGRQEIDFGDERLLAVRMAQNSGEI